MSDDAHIVILGTLTRRRILAAGVTIAALACAPAADAAIQQGNLVLNGDGESGVAVTDETSAVCPQAWTCIEGLRRSDRAKIEDLSRRQLARRRLKLTATTTVGTEQVKQTSLLLIKRR